MKKISGSYLEIDYAFEQSIKSLVKRKNKSYSDLKQPLNIKLSVDGTIHNNKYRYVAYSLCAYEYEDKEYVSVSNLVLLALISCDESYEI
jgi:mannosyltransferase OCH1-like enzyme